MIIYKITNKINNKIYIGQTVKSLKLRWKQHCNGNRHSLALSNAIKKYGIDGFNIEIVDFAENLEELNKKEEEYINKFNSLAPNGYNLMTGGIRPKFSEESKKRMGRKGSRHPLYGKKHSEESKKKISESHKGKKLTKDHKLNISNSRVGKPNHNREIFKKRNDLKKISIICNENGIIYDSISSAANSLNTSTSNICNNLQGKYKQIKGFTFSLYKERS